MPDCDNYANITGSGYKSAFPGKMGYGTVKTITATRSKNYGTIVSTNAEAAMLVSNSGYFNSERAVYGFKRKDQKVGRHLLSEL